MLTAEPTLKERQCKCGRTIWGPTGTRFWVCTWQKWDSSCTNTKYPIDGGCKETILIDVGLDAKFCPYCGGGPTNQPKEEDEE